MDELIVAAILAVWGLANAIIGYRFHRGRAEYLRRRDYPGSSWSQTQRRFPYSLYPLAAMMLLTAAEFAGDAFGVVSTPLYLLYLVLMLALAITMIVFMKTRPSWLASPGPPVAPPAALKITQWPDNGTVRTLPRPLDEMTPEEIRAWARDDPARAKRLLKWMKREYGI
jgi:hypothetical protein